MARRNEIRYCKGLNSLGAPSAMRSGTVKASIVANTMVSYSHVGRDSDTSDILLNEIDNFLGEPFSGLYSHAVYRKEVDLFALV